MDAMFWGELNRLANNLHPLWPTTFCCNVTVPEIFAELPIRAPPGFTTIPEVADTLLAVSDANTDPLFIVIL